MQLKSRRMARKQPKAPIKTHLLTNVRTGKKDEFPLHDDKEVGLGEQWILDHTVEARMDDDVDTDEEIYTNAQNSIRLDCKEAAHDIKKHKGNWEWFVNNCRIGERVARPDFHDRNGRYRSPPRSPRSSTRVNLPESFRSAQSTGHTFDELF